MRAAWACVHAHGTRRLNLTNGVITMTTATTSPGIRPAALAAATVPVLPESAPFSAAQRAWLNGFFAGIVGTQSGCAAVAPASASASPTAAAPAAEAPAVEEDFPWHDATI